MTRSSASVDYLSHLFAILNREQIGYCVLRNYEQLPIEIGNDIDIWVKDGEQQRFAEAVYLLAKELEWRVVNYSPRLSFKGEGNYFLARVSRTIETIHLDCWTFIYWKGLVYVDESQILRNIELHPNGFYIPHKGVQAATMLLKNLLYHSTVQEKYKQSITDYSNADPSSFLAVLRKPFGEGISYMLLNSAQTANWKRLEQNCAHLRLMLFLRAAFLQCRSFYRYLSLYVAGLFKRLFSPKTGLFLVFIGPDGSGKTTLANALINSEIKRFFQKKTYFHAHFPYLPELKRFLFWRGSNIKSSPLPVSPSPFNLFRATIYPLYYGFNHFLGHLLVWKTRYYGGLMIFDRYFYDYLLLKQFLNCPRFIIFSIAKLLPRPDAVIYLKSDPELIHKRKPELSVSEIERQQKICDNMIDKFARTYVIQTSVPPEEAVAHIEAIVLDLLQEKESAKQ